MNISGRSAIASGAANQMFVVPRDSTITAIYVTLNANEGAAATLAVTLDTCNSNTCGAQTTTAATCTVGNSANSCNATGLSVAVSAGTAIVVQTVQSGTGTAAVGTVGVAYQ